MADILTGYSFDKVSKRFRSGKTGKFVSRKDVNALMEKSVNDAVTRMNKLGDALQAGKISPSNYVQQMKLDIKRQHLQQAALGKGGFDRLDQRDYGRVGAAVRDLYPKISGTATDIQNDDVSEAQLHQRNNSYAGSARTVFHKTESDNLPEADSGETWIEKRFLDPEAQHCEDCLDYASRGWRMAGELPEPGAECQCGGNCRCRKERKKVTADKLSQFLGESESMTKVSLDAGTVDIREVAEEPLVTDLVEKAVRKDGTVLLRIIKPGWGSSGYYSPDVLERDGPQVFKRGTQMFWDHQTPEETAQRPEGSMDDFSAVLTEDSYWNPAGPSGPALYANAKVFSDFTTRVNEKAPHSGISIRGKAEFKWGEAEGRSGKIIEKIIEGNSVDFVTKPGAGGQVEILESATHGKHIEESGNPAEESEMSEKLETQLNEAVGRLTQLEESNNELRTQNARLNEALQMRDARDYVSQQIASSTLPDVTKSRLVEQLSANPPIVEGKLDKKAYATRIQEAVKAETEYLQQVAGYGSGRIEGMGGNSQQLGGGQKIDEEKLHSQMNNAFAALGLTESEAAHAANGRVRAGGGLNGY